MRANNATAYQVGFGKPPKNSQFRKGVSGNPGGRPKGSRNLATILQDILQETVVVQENRKRRRVSKSEAMFRNLVNRAISGDMAAIKRVTELVPAQEFEQPRTEPIKTEDGVLIPNALLQRRLVKRINSLYGLKSRQGLSHIIITEKQAAKMSAEINRIFGWQPNNEQAVKMANRSLLVKEADELAEADQEAEANA